MYDKTHNYLNFRKNIKDMLTFIFLWVLSPQRKMNASMLQVQKFFSVCLPFSFSAYFCFSLINSVSWLSVRWAAAMRPFFITMLSGTLVRPRRMKKGLSTILPSQTT